MYIMCSFQVMILITGAHKAYALHKAIEDGVSHMWTVSAFQQHPKTVFVCDEDATMELKVKTVKYFKGLMELHNRSVQDIQWTEVLSATAFCLLYIWRIFLRRRCLVCVWWNCYGARFYDCELQSLPIRLAHKLWYCVFIEIARSWFWFLRKSNRWIAMSIWPPLHLMIVHLNSSYCIPLYS